MCGWCADAMANQILTRAQANEILGFIQKAGLDPQHFRWGEWSDFDPGGLRRKGALFCLIPADRNFKGLFDFR